MASSPSITLRPITSISSAADQLAKSYHFLRRLIEILEGNRCYQNLFPYGEPQLGKRGVYREMGDADQTKQLAMLWVLSLSDGRCSLLDIAERSGVEFDLVRHAAEVLAKCGVLQEISNVRAP